MFLAPPPQWNTLTGYNSTGSLYSLVSSVDNCGVSCLQDLSCVGFGWDPIPNMCYIHTDVNQFNVKQATQNSANFTQHVLTRSPACNSKSAQHHTAIRSIIGVSWPIPEAHVRQIGTIIAVYLSSWGYRFLMMSWSLFCCSGDLRTVMSLMCSRYTFRETATHLSRSSRIEYL